MERNERDPLNYLGARSMEMELGLQTLPLLGPAALFQIDVLLSLNHLRACVRVCMRACIRVYMFVCVCVCVCGCVGVGGLMCFGVWVCFQHFFLKAGLHGNNSTLMS